MVWNVMWKDWLHNYNQNRTKFLSELLNCWSFVVMVCHHDPECHAKRLVILKVQVIAYNKSMTLQICWTADPFGTKRSVIVRHRNLGFSLAKRLNCCVQGQGHSEGSCLIYTFLYHWSLSNPNRCAAVLITNNQTKCKQKRVRKWLRVSLGTQEEVFCHTEWQTLFAWEVIMTPSLRFDL